MCERCPKCGADMFADAHTLERHVIDGVQCLRNQLAQARDRISELERDLDDETEERIVVLFRENEQLREHIGELTRERDTLRAKLDDLLAQRMSEVEGKLATRPVEQVVEELQAENRRLREVAERVVRANKDVERHGYASLRRMVYALENVLWEVREDA